MKIIEKSKNAFNKAKEVIPGGVNSPVRSFKTVGGNPLFADKAKGPTMIDIDGNKYIDYCGSWGSMILGHAETTVIKEVSKRMKNGTSYGMPTCLETELAELIVAAVPSIEQVRMTSSGTEAVMSAVRLARAYTSRNKIIKFAGAYHGHADYLLVQAGSGAASLGVATSKGVPDDFARHTIVVPYNDLPKIKEVMGKEAQDIAAILVEPVLANCGVIQPHAGFLEGLRQIADKSGAFLIFDEVITGFRMSYGGAQEYYKVMPDLTALGKIIGGGFPVGAFGGKKDVMELLAPIGQVYQAGTLSGNPIAMRAGIETLKTLKKINPYDDIRAKTEAICAHTRECAKKRKVRIVVNNVESLFSVFFCEFPVTDYFSAKKQNAEKFKIFFNGLLNRGVYFSPSGFETNFVSTSHEKKDIKKTIEVIDIVMSDMGKNNLQYENFDN